MFNTREMEKGDVPKQETLGDYLQEYESQSKRFKDHLNFQGFFKIKEERSTRGKQHDVGRLFLSTFYGSAKCSARAWVEKLNTYLQQHQISEDEAIKVAALHFEGKAYAWWLFESFSLINENTSTYARFTKRVMEIFDEKHSETPLVGLEKPKQTKPLHGLEGSINPTPFQKTIEEDNILQNPLL